MVLFGLAAVAPTPALAQCAGVIDGGGNTVTCAAGSDAGTIDLQGGNDGLTMSGTYMVGNISIFGGDGSDSVVVSGGSFDTMAAGSLLIGGNFGEGTSAGDDALTFDGFVGVLPAGVSNWDTINVVNGANITYRDGNGYSLFLDDANPGALFNLTAGATVSIAADGNALNDAKFTNIGSGEFRLNGTVALANGEIGDLFFVQSQSGMGTFSGSGTVTVDVLIDDLINGPNMGTGGSDVFWTVGAAAVPGTSIGIAVNIVGIGPNPGTTDLIPLVLNQGPDVIPADTYFLIGDQLLAGNYVYGLVYDEDFFMDWDQWALQNLGVTPGLQTYAAHVTIAQRLWGSGVRTLRERLGYMRGEEAGSIDLAAAPAERPQYASLDQLAGMEDGGERRQVGVSLWAEGLFDITNDDGQGGSDIGYRSTATGLLVGGDVAFDGLLGDGDRTLVGLFAGYGATSADFADGLGSLDLDGAMVGAYATYSGGGFYVDAVLAYQGLNFEAANGTTGAETEYEGEAWGGSLEVGYRIGLGGFELEPQVQLTYVGVSHEDFVDSMGASVSDDEGHSLQLRGGLRASTTFDLGEVKARPYLDIGVVHEFSDDNQVVVLGSEFEDPLFDTAFEVGGGITLDLTDEAHLFVDVDYRAAADYSSVNGVVGLRYAF